MPEVRRGHFSPSPSHVVRIAQGEEEIPVPELLDHLFRHQAGRMISSLTRHFGVENLELVEDIVQETLLKALQQWPYRGIPENPDGWLWQAAKNHALDLLRRETRLQKILAGTQNLLKAEQASVHNDPPEEQLGDDQLSMMFIGCHPSLSRDSQVTLLLKIVGGFSVAEIAQAFLLSEAAIAQRLVRAKNKLRVEGVRFELPPESELVHRLDTVLEILYLIFNEGYDAHLGDTLVRKDLCDESIHLCKSILEHRFGKTPKVYALLALMLLQASRLNARTDAAGELLLLAEQDRKLWDRMTIQEGLYYLGLSAQGDELTEYHLQAGIAARHAVAKDYESTDWAGILDDYDVLLKISPSPVILLNHAVALAMVHGTEAGLRELIELKDHPSMQKYRLLYATMGELYERSGNINSAVESYRMALSLTTNIIERRFLEKKLKQATL
jgi:RNA polymerase sigma factor (sigma-70 family)